MADQTDKKNVLVVDDDVDFLEQHKLLLEKSGFHVITADSQADAESKINDVHLDLAVVDVMMEHADAGFNLCYHLKKKNPQLPIIIVTSVSSETGLDFDAHTEEERSWIKADALLSKPLRYEQLKREIDRLLEPAK
jgi:CheY-like chemotaxis protein